MNRPSDTAGAVKIPAASESTHSRLEHCVFTDWHQMCDLKGAWNDLAARVGDVFGSYDWCSIWWQHFSRNRQLEVHTLHYQGRLLGVLPLFRETLSVAGLRLRVVRLLACDYTIDAAGLTMEPECAKPLIDHVLSSLARRGAWDILHLGPLRNYVTATEAIADTAQRHPQVGTVIIGRQDNWITEYDLPDTYEQYLHSLAGDERRDTARRERKLHHDHQVEVSHVTDPAQVPAAMDALVALHQQLWAHKGQRGQFGDWPAFEMFHRQVAQRMAEAGQLVLLTIKVDGQVRGAAYGYHFGPRTHQMIRGYADQPPWRNYALGRQLHCNLVQQAIARGSQHVDDGRGVFDYKLRLGGQLRGEQSLIIVRRGRAPWIRFWAALRLAYAEHVIYCRLWFDRLAPRLGLKCPLRHSYIRGGFLAQTYRRVRVRLFGQPATQEMQRAPAPGERVDTKRVRRRNQADVKAGRRTRETGHDRPQDR